MFQAVRLNAVTYPVEPAERAELAAAGAELTECIPFSEPGPLAPRADPARHTFFHRSIGRRASVANGRSMRRPCPADA
jgi:hypothetical protein